MGVRQALTTPQRVAQAGLARRAPHRRARVDAARRVAQESDMRVGRPRRYATNATWPVNVLEQQQPDHEPGLDPGRAILAEERRDLAVDPVPIDLASELNQLVLHVDDLVQPRPEQVIDPVALCFFGRIVPSDAPQNHGQQLKGNQNQIAEFGRLKRRSLQSQMPPHPNNRFLLNRLEAWPRMTR